MSDWTDEHFGLGILGIIAGVVVLAFGLLWLFPDHTPKCPPGTQRMYVYYGGKNAHYSFHGCFSEGDTQ